jgi:hypothetical protein
MPIDANWPVDSAELVARVDAPLLAAQPLAVEQVRAGELCAQGSAKVLDRVAEPAHGGVALAHERS